MSGEPGTGQPGTVASTVLASAECSTVGMRGRSIHLVARTLAGEEKVLF